MLDSTRGACLLPDGNAVGTKFEVKKTRKKIF